MKMFDTVESNMENAKLDLSAKRAFVGCALPSGLEPRDGVYQNMHTDMDGNIARWLGLEDAGLVGPWRVSVFDTVKKMLDGDGKDGQKTLGLKKISTWKVNPEYQYSNLKQHAGYAAEVISTAKENLLAHRDGSGTRTYRADDRPDLFQKNDPYVDKVRVNQNGEIIERVQTKFVGEDGADCLSKLASKKFDKYFNDGKVDKVEIPKDFYDEIKSKDLIGQKLKGLERQLERVKADGNTEAAKSIQNKIERYQKIDQMIERSTVSNREAIYATKHPQRYASKLFAKDILNKGNQEGLKSGLVAAGITFTVSTVDHMPDFIDGKISAEEMVVEIAKDTGAAGALGYGTVFISTAVSQSLSHSSSALIQRVGGSCLPAAVVSFAVDSYDSISDFAQGDITGSELAYDLGESAASVGGSFAGGALTGAAVGAVAGPVGGVVGGIVGGVVGCAIATEAYQTAVELGAEGAQELAQKAEGLANETIDLVRENAPDKLGEVKAAFQDFAKSSRLPDWNV